MTESEILAFVRAHIGCSTAEIVLSFGGNPQGVDWIETRAVLDDLVRQGRCYQQDVHGITRFYV